MKYLVTRQLFILEYILDALYSLHCINTFDTFSPPIFSVLVNTNYKRIIKYDILLGNIFRYSVKSSCLL